MISTLKINTNLYVLEDDKTVTLEQINKNWFAFKRVNDITQNLIATAETFDILVEKLTVKYLTARL